VIIDNMMNLELLFEATALSGDSTFYNIADDVFVLFLICHAIAVQITATNHETYIMMPFQIFQQSTKMGVSLTYRWKTGAPDSFPVVYG